jgi:type VI secretion system protein ImpM
MELSMSCGSLGRWPEGRWLFGKMPAHGDFVARGIDAAERDQLDRWLTAEMEAARTVWAAEFDDRYAAAPAWCFIGADVRGGWSGGMLCASMDRVGRLFPLALAGPADDPADAVAVAGGCLDLVAEAFAQGWDADRLNGSALVPVPLPWAPSAEAWALVGEDGPAIELPGLQPRGIVERMVEMAA